MRFEDGYVIIEETEYENTLTDRYEKGRKEGYDEGYDNGHELGYDDGYNDGYDAGYEAAVDKQESAEVHEDYFETEHGVDDTDYGDHDGQ